MGDEQTEAATGQADQEVNLLWAERESELNLDELEPQAHGDFIQRGNYIICGCHGHEIRIPNDMQLTKKPNGDWNLVPIVIQA